MSYLPLHIRYPKCKSTCHAQILTFTEHTHLRHRPRNTSNPLHSHHASSTHHLHLIHCCPRPLPACTASHVIHRQFHSGLRSSTHLCCLGFLAFCVYQSQREQHVSIRRFLAFLVHIVLSSMICTSVWLSSDLLLRFSALVGTFALLRLCLMSFYVSCFKSSPHTFIIVFFIIIVFISSRLVLAA